MKEMEKGRKRKYWRVTFERERERGGESKRDRERGRVRETERERKKDKVSEKERDV
jgi:hypothetical protein